MLTESEGRNVLTHPLTIVAIMLPLCVSAVSIGYSTYLQRQGTFVELSFGAQTAALNGVSGAWFFGMLFSAVFAAMAAIKLLTSGGMSVAIMLVLWLWIGVVMVGTFATGTRPFTLH